LPTARSQATLPVPVAVLEIVLKDGGIIAVALFSV
jgi:hypothetical protein